MSGWALACLATMATALVAMALAQMSIALAVLRIARQAVETVQEFRRELRPIVDKVNKMADDASRVTAMAVAQMERVEQAIGTTVGRIEETLGIVQDALGEPMRQGAAVMAGLRAAFSVFRGRSARPKHGRDDEDALFIG